MSEEKVKRQFGNTIINEVKEMVLKGKTQKEIAEHFGLKSECIYRNKPKDFQQARLLIDDYIYFYNYERIQLKTKLTPYEKRCQPV